MPPLKVKADRETEWNALYRRLLQYKETYGNCLVPDRYKDDRQLSFWVQEQRKRKHKGIMKPNQLKKLDDIDFTWQVRDSWDDTFNRLVDYKMKYGNCNVPRNFKSDMKLGRWVNKQRSSYCKDDGMSFPKDRLAKLNSIGFVFRRKTANKWEDMFDRLNTYKEKHGNCMVPQDYVDDPQLGRWVNNRRVDYHKGNLSQKYIDQLKTIDFAFGDTRDNLWDEMYNRLNQYKEKYGNCLVPKNWKQDIKLSNWVYVQRKKKSTVSQERKSRLNDIGFVWGGSTGQSTCLAKISHIEEMSQESPICCKSIDESNLSWLSSVDNDITASRCYQKLLPPAVDHKFAGKKYFPIQHGEEELDAFMKSTQLFGNEDLLFPHLVEYIESDKNTIMEREFSTPSLQVSDQSWQHMQPLSSNEGRERNTVTSTCHASSTEEYGSNTPVLVNTCNGLLKVFVDDREARND